MVLTFHEARAEVLKQIPLRCPAVETVALESAAGRILAEDIAADRDYPPFHRATRDGYALRAADGARPLAIIGEVRAGSEFAGRIGAGECVSIMTGAPVPEGADAVVMVEHTSLPGGQMTISRSLQVGANIVPRGSESAAGSRVLSTGLRIGFPEVAMLAGVGRAAVPVFRRPRVAIIPTGDEIVELDREPSAVQIRNSNSYSLRTQTARAGGDPWPLPIAPDEPSRLRELIEQGLTADLLVLSGGVSMGKFDLVEQVLADLGAEIFFEGVKIQPGRPLVSGRARGTPFFGLPGNPLSTMVCFELFARVALERLSGAVDRGLVFPRARLAADVRVAPGLWRFLPALVSGEDPVVELTGWHGSGDVASLVRSNCFLVVPDDRPELKKDDLVGILHF